MLKHSPNHASVYHCILLFFQRRSVFHDLGKVPHICGGWKNLECFRYQPANDTWVVSGTLAYSHHYPGFTYHKELGLVMSGGDNGGNGNGSTKVEHTLDGQTIKVFV